MPLTLLGRPSSVNVQKALWALAEVKAAFTLRHASAMLGKGPEYGGSNTEPLTSTPEYLEYNPTGLVPTLTIEGEGSKPSQGIFESATIVRYIARKYDADGEVFKCSTPEDEARASSWMDYCGGNLSDTGGQIPAMVNHSTRFAKKDRDPAKLAEAVVGFSKRLGLLEEQLAKTQAFVAGQEFTVADVPVGCVVNRYIVAQLVLKERHPEQPLDGKVDTPSIEAWHERLKERPAFYSAVFQSELLHVRMKGADDADVDLPGWYKEYMSS
ncbi:hypothetical protein TrVE_jg5884 [Triparma verrucosa]|uniref:Glutathione S-transferase n=1 Tax=Triparma verrucosa TaxID=1606542 RepID=A0A9W7KTP2_9STRA|nr:hypothetical protein TrVE_jg5884 [Triparma verrucosa]